MWEDEDEHWGVGAWIGIGVVIVAVLAGVSIAVSVLPFRLVASGGIVAAVAIAAHLLFVRLLPGDEPLGFWKAWGLDALVGAWQLVTFVALCRHGAWAALGRLGARLGQPDTLTPDGAIAVIAVAYLAWLGIRVLEDRPTDSFHWGTPWLTFGLKIALMFGFAGFLTWGGEAWLKSLFR